MQLEDGARKASAALPGMLSLTDGITADDIRRMTLQIMACCKNLEVRLVEGIAVPLTVMTKILEALHLPWADDLFAYIQQEIVPAHMKRLGHATPSTITGGVFSALVSDIVSDLTPEQIPDMVKINGNSLVLRIVELPKQLQQRASELPGGRYKNVRMGQNRKAMKCRVYDVAKEAGAIRKILTDLEQAPIQAANQLPAPAPLQAPNEQPQAPHEPPQVPPPTIEPPQAPHEQPQAPHEPPQVPPPTIEPPQAPHEQPQVPPPTIELPQAPHEQPPTNGQPQAHVLPPLQAAPPVNETEVAEAEFQTEPPIVPPCSLFKVVKKTKPGGAKKQKLVANLPTSPRRKRAKKSTKNEEFYY